MSEDAKQPRKSRTDPSFWGGLWLRQARWIMGDTVEGAASLLDIGAQTLHRLELGQRDLKSEAKAARICEYIMLAFEMPNAREKRNEFNRLNGIKPPKS